LEEVDELFAANLWAWQFKKYETHGTGRLLAALENEGAAMGKVPAEVLELPDDPKRVLTQICLGLLELLLTISAGWAT
jgi:hypothetical protein